MDQRKAIGLLLALFLLLGTGNLLPPTSSAQTASPTATPTPIRTLTDVNEAIVRIRAIGDFFDPKEGEPSNAVAGTGFLVDPSGLVVTANHVVAGAQTIQVFVPGDERPHSARVVGLSECSDLALVDLAGRGYPYLSWADEDVEPGATVYAAGYPSEQVSITEGSVEEIFTESHSNLISVDREIMHTAMLSPGNSGGPLVNEEGEVVGVNFGESVDGDRFAAVPQSEAQIFLERLRQDESTVLGINGVAWTEGERTGVWIIAAHPDSPASAAGLEPGDILIELDGVALGLNQTVEGFCDVLQGWDGSEPLSFTAIDADGNEWTGAFVADAVPDWLHSEGFHLVETEAFAALLPAAWSDTETELDADDSSFIFSAALRLGPDRVYEGSSGITVLVQETSGPIDLEGVLDSVGNPDPSCQEGERLPHQHTFGGITYAGMYDVWIDCFAVNASFFVLAAQPDTQDQLLFATFLALTQEDDRRFDVFRNTVVTHPLPLPAQGAPTAPEVPEVEPPSIEAPATEGAAETENVSATATVLVPALNVRSGPGTNFSRIAGVNEGDVLTARGRVADCGWIAITTPSGVEGWVAADPDYVSLDVSCVTLPVVQVPTVPAATPTPAASAPPTPTAVPLPADETQGCFLFDNQIGVEVTITFTHQNEVDAQTFTLAPNSEESECFSPGT